ncbi:hypothetical protein BDQ12DRAFT_645012 [Crucibulum laeve]|uniref:Hamartin protein-domain-containing protein n=1 Tax=Crucibulum laeve TaxID=68775 RepID=A0A5C3MEA7_9AGAR|nr:hypothetical protein BDQ12DRAFT_645012 [Crucibulum laeve]
MPNSSLSRQIRLALESASDALSITELIGLVDQFVLECSSSDSDSLVYQLEEELQSIHHEVVDYSSLYQIEIFLAVLYHLGPVLSCISVISWFDLVLRPALREPKLPTAAVNYAKELIISALQKKQEVYTDQVGHFRRRLLELYLHDAFNEGSENDILEWAGLEEEQREKRTRWKMNLEDILVKYGSECPEELMTEVNTHFATPTSRLQLLMLLEMYSSSPSFASGAVVIAKHPLIDSLMYSLFLDNSSTVCTAGLTLLVKLLPFLAVHARQDLRNILPKLLAILARIMCWRERPPSNTPGPENIDIDFERELESEANRVLQIHPDFEWNRLEMSFNATTSPPPSSRPYFTALYYLYPSNVLRFLRAPVQYLETNDIPSLYVETWEEALDQDEIRRRSENLLREHVCHPLLVWRDAVVELSEPEFWVRYNVARITSEMVMLDVRNHAMGLRARYNDTLSMQFEGRPPIKPSEPSKDETHSLGSGPEASVKHVNQLDISSGKVVVSLQDMINTSVALKSNLKVVVVNPTLQWPRPLFENGIASPSHSSFPLPDPSDQDMYAAHVAQAIAGLQREVLLLRNELNFELWLSRENAKHIGRLYQDRVLMKTAEAERQGLYNKLRKYRAQVINLEKELLEHKEQASSAKNKYADWNIELQKKLKELREEKKSWISEAAALRNAEKEAQALFAAQGKLLADAAKEVFDLQTQKKENQHKIDRLKDYEAQLEQHVKIQRLWDGDFARFNERAEQITAMHTQHKQMLLRLESLEKTQAKMEDNACISRLQIQTLQARLAQEKLKAAVPRASPAHEIATFVNEKSALINANKKLKDENHELKDEVEELQAMVKVLKGQYSGRKGLISEHKPSPLTHS